MVPKRQSLAYFIDKLGYQRDLIIWTCNSPPTKSPSRVGLPGDKFPSDGMHEVCNGEQLITTMREPVIERSCSPLCDRQRGQRDGAEGLHVPQCVFVSSTQRTSADFYG